MDTTVYLRITAGKENAYKLASCLVGSICKVINDDNLEWVLLNSTNQGFVICNNDMTKFKMVKVIHLDTSKLHVCPYLAMRYGISVSNSDFDDCLISTISASGMMLLGQYDSPIDNTLTLNMTKLISGEIINV